MSPLLACRHHSGADRDNSVSAFLTNAERQAETDEQRVQIRQALSDLLDRSPKDLQEIRYPDYSGQANQWDIMQLLQHYFVPNPPAALNQSRFFKEVRAPEARIAIQHQLDDVNRALQTNH